METAVFNSKLIRRTQEELSELSAEYARKYKDTRARIMGFVTIDIYDDLADLQALRIRMNEKQRLLDLLEKGEIE